MAVNNKNILAGLGNPSLMYVAPVDTPGPVAVPGGVAEVQTITLTGTATAGTFPVTNFGLTYSAPYNVTASVMQSALRSLWNMAALTVGLTGAVYTITYDANYGPLPLVTTNSLTLTGATAAAARTTPGTTLTMATAPIPTGFTDVGWCETTGLVAKIAETSTAVKGYGSLVTLRTIISASDPQFDISFLETNPTVINIYNRQPLGTVVANSAGAFNSNFGIAGVQFYAAIFDVADGANRLRVYCPRLQVATKKDRTISNAAVIQYGVTLQATPDANNIAVYESYVVAALAA